MNKRLKTMVLSGFLAGSLVMTAAPAMAWDWPWNHRDHRVDDHRWEDRRRNDREWNDNEYGHLRGSQSDYEALQQARQQALYDASHHASRKKIAEDDAVVDEMLNRMHGR
ncbi:MAG TPA: hypothetical protein VMO00_09125 [Methylomirabilota bacterium]|nr:hypothetical protein [Methylomirabilota bacterium]